MSNKVLKRPIANLQDSDFDQNGNLINPNILKDNKPVVVMIQAGFCGHCTTAKPAFIEFANAKQDSVFCATINGDDFSVPGTKELSQRIGQIKPGFAGFPDYMVFKGGKRINKDIQGRDVQSLIEFAKV